ncbi:C2 domain-containing protein [Rutstroemia sp. NJR-2017a WRK4]|nr:C2 domain-containing protein [Rutstroemia sp. NJR-2017a WRK4]
MSTLIDKLTTEGGGESAGFLNDIVAQLWPNIQVAGSKMVKDIVEPMFKTMLPGPLATLHFTKIELGATPIVLSNVKVTKTAHDGIKLDLNVDWNGQCDIELDGNMMPKVGVKEVVLNGRLSILLCPLTNIIPLIGAAQISFINPPNLKLNFTGAANVADLSLIDDAVRKVLMGIINSIVVLPNRIMVKLDTNNDYFKTYHQPLGIVRITAEKAWGFAEESQSKTKKLFSKLTRASPDCYAEIEVGAEPAWRTTTKDNTTTPVWGETHDFVVTDFDQRIKVVVSDHDLNSDDEVGEAVTTVKEILVASGKQELAMVHKGAETDGKVALSCEFFQFTAEDTSSFSASSHSGDGLMCGIVTVLIAGAFGIKGQRETLKPSVVVTWGSKHRFQTAVQTDAPGTDINNPTFDQHFRIPVAAADVSAGNLRIICMDKDTEIGAVEIPFEDLQKAPDMTLQDNFDVGDGVRVRASISLRGVRSGSM